jgi:hypothetical protein
MRVALVSERASDTEIGFLVRRCADQDHDGVADLLVASYNDETTPFTWIVSGNSGKSLRVLKKNMFDVLSEMSNGVVAFSTSDLDSSNDVGLEDILEYHSLEPGALALDVNLDGVESSADTMLLLSDYAAGTQVVSADETELNVDADAWLLLDPTAFSPACHHTWLALSARSFAALRPAISTVCTPEGVAAGIVAGCGGMTNAQIIALLRSMGFSIAVIAAVLGMDELAVQAVLDAATEYAWCIGLYAAYKASCAAARSCKGTADPTQCETYRANYLANAACAILRSRHMDRCIPAKFRDIWDPEGGHAAYITNSWNAAAKCAEKMREANCTNFPQLRPPRLPGDQPLSPISNNVPVACTGGAIRYALDSCEGCVSTSIEHFASSYEIIVDQSWVDAELMAP